MLFDVLRHKGREPFILFNHKLGVAYWCIPPLYKYSLELFRECTKRYRVDRSRESQLVCILLFILFYFILFYFILFYFILFYFILFYFILLFMHL